MDYILLPSFAGFAMLTVYAIWRLRTA
ncbi:MAG: mercury resistance system transport protein MerF [Methyloligellaceae bacterium]